MAKIELSIEILSKGESTHAGFRSLRRKIGGIDDPPKIYWLLWLRYGWPDGQDRTNGLVNQFFRGRPKDQPGQPFVAPGADYQQVDGALPGGLKNLRGRIDRFAQDGFHTYLF